MFYLSMSSLTVAQTNIYQKRNLFVFCCHGEKENVVKTLSYTIYAIVESFYQNPRILRILLSVVIKQLKHKVK